MSEIKPVAWTNEAQLGFVADTKWSGTPMAMWGKRDCYAQPDIALCRHDEAMAEIERLRQENGKLRNKIPARNLTDIQLADEITAIDNICDSGFGEGSGSPGEWYYERADELEHERKRRVLERHLAEHNASAKSLKVKP